MDTVLEMISTRAKDAHWYAFGALLLAGMNFPISADVVILISALIAATLVPENTIKLYLAIFLGCWGAAMIGYWIGRLFGTKLFAFKWFKKLLPEARLAKIQAFYGNYGFLTLALGRFIPFGFRNGLFMTAGIAKMPFTKFLWRDLIACFIWTSLSFSIFFLLGHNYELLCHYLKTFNIFIFSAFGVTVITLLWYKKIRKKKQLSDKNSSEAAHEKEKNDEVAGSEISSSPPLNSARKNDTDS